MSTSTNNDANSNPIPGILRRVDKWACVQKCGACCKLGPLSSRPDLETYLNPEEFASYESMIGSDDWCKHFDKEKRICKIYDERPEFCRVEPKKFKSMYGIAEDELNDFCAFCCREQIADVYGDESDEMIRFEDVIDALQAEDDIGKLTGTDSETNTDADEEDGGIWLPLHEEEGGGVIDPKHLQSGEDVP